MHITVVQTLIEYPYVINYIWVHEVYIWKSEVVISKCIEMAGGVCSWISWSYIAVAASAMLGVPSHW